MSDGFFILPAKVVAEIYMGGSRAEDFARQVSRYRLMTDEDLVKMTELYLRNMGRVDSRAEVGPDFDLQVVLVPELCERIVAGSRDRVRRISTSSAEYDDSRPSIFRRMLSEESIRELAASARSLRADIAAVSALPIEALVERARFAIHGSRSSDRFGPCAAVYEPAFVYRLAPVLAVRAADRANSGRRS